MMETTDRWIDGMMDDIDARTLMRTMKSKLFQKAYEEYLMEEGTVKEVERYCLLHAKAAVMSDGKLVRFDAMDLPDGWWRREDVKEL